ncbi:antitoxin MazE-like protein [Telmatospirillum sp.]|uniref:antitoxin MazE-like protein n=1 Tax=Telmatospirillum sp. TaxID=2079197 RepID=UPI00285026DD|nr:antitoxin MazE-like protein [Telmatospirillum sp.]MDR3435463.1 DUF3018 family protein [Telmatospirillum sp.]
MNAAHLEVSGRGPRAMIDCFWGFTAQSLNPNNAPTVPDVRATSFQSEAHRQSLAVAASAQTDAERARAMLESSGQPAITPKMVRKFAETARQRTAVTAATTSGPGPGGWKWRTTKFASSDRKATCSKR